MNAKALGKLIKIPSRQNLKHCSLPQKVMISGYIQGQGKMYKQNNEVMSNMLNQLNFYCF